MRETPVMLLPALVVRAQDGDLEAYTRMVEVTQAMVCGVARGVVRDPELARDVAQETYLRAFRRLGDLNEPTAFLSWLRRIAISVAVNMARRRRMTLLTLDDIPELPILDELETRWSERQRERLAAALLVLTAEQRRICDRHYHGGWSIARLAGDAGISEPAMRKRLQRIRDVLRKEIEVEEQKEIRPGNIQPELPKKVVELLAHPRLTDLPENPVGQTVQSLRSVFPDFEEIELPEVVHLTDADRTVAADAIYVDRKELHHLDGDRILRYDLTLPLLLAVRYTNQPLRYWAAGKVYRACNTDATHLEAFHQAELLWVDERNRIDPWQATGKVLQSVDAFLPGSTVKIVPTQYPMCSQAWDLEVEYDGRWSEVLAWGVYTDRIIRHIGGDPSQISAVGVGYGLERLAMLRYGIDDIRKIDVARVG